MDFSYTVQTRLNGCSSSADTGVMSGGESQHSQVSLFSGSEGPNSLELFSQPPSNTQNSTTSTATQSQSSSTAVLKLKSTEICGQPSKVAKCYLESLTVYYQLLLGQG